MVYHYVVRKRPYISKDKNLNAVLARLEVYDCSTISIWDDATTILAGLHKYELKKLSCPKLLKIVRINKKWTNKCFYLSMCYNRIHESCILLYVKGQVKYTSTVSGDLLNFQSLLIIGSLGQPESVRFILVLWFLEENGNYVEHWRQAQDKSQRC